MLVLVALLSLPLFTPRLYGADEIKYVTHLRSLWFDHDLHYANEYDYFVRRDPQAFGWLRNLRDTVTVTGRRLNDAPIGAAVLWAPFYGVADGAVLLARAFGAAVPRDGFSWPYVWAVCLGSLFWGVAGLALVYRLCRLWYAPWPSRWATLSVWFATPVVFYLYITPPMAHADSLFAVALFLWLWARSRPERSFGGWLALGAAAGLMVLVRELNWLMLTPLLLDEACVVWRHGRQGRWRCLRERLPGQVAAGAVLVLVVLPQFLVYQALHGGFSPTPFVVQKFGWPVHVHEVLLSGFHGLYSWSPVTLAGTLGLWLLRRRDPVVAAGAATAFALQVLVVGSYATWWGGASFGARRFINCMPLFALGLAALLDALPAARRRLGALALVAAIAWNFGLAVQYGTGMIPRDAPVSLRTIARNQLVQVPGRAVRVGWRFLTDRWSLVRIRPDGSGRSE